MSQKSVTIDLDIDQLMSIVKQLSDTEKEKLHEAIWDDNMSIPIEHQKLVLERRAKSKEDPSRMLDWDEASKMLRSK